MSFLKAVAAEDAHPGYSGPLDEQRFIVAHAQRAAAVPEWGSTAVIIAYDDSDGWYDHAHLRPSRAPTWRPTRSTATARAPDRWPRVTTAGAAALARGCRSCVISPYAKQNYIDHTQLEQTSIIRFIEDNWGLGRIGDQSFDARPPAYGGLLAMFDFARRRRRAEAV